MPMIIMTVIIVSASMVFSVSSIIVSTVVSCDREIFLAEDFLSFRIGSSHSEEYDAEPVGEQDFVECCQKRDEQDDM